MDALLKSWKTGLTGIVVIGLTAGFLMKLITLEQFLGAFGALAGGGLLMAKDAAQG